MRYLAAAFDYDGTIAHHGVVAPDVIEELESLRASGRRLVLVTGRELDDLQRVFDRLDLFERVVAENGGLLYRPSLREELPLCDPPPEEFVQALRDRGVSPLSCGRVIVATWHPNEEAVLECIRDQGLELHVIFNKGAVMVLPSGVNKATGLTAALAEMGLSAHNVVGIGDAENDHAFLAVCEAFAATENAVPALKQQADWITDAPNGAGVAQLARALIDCDLANADPARRFIPLGTRGKDAEVLLSPYGDNVLLAGPSGSGKTTIATGWIERLAGAGYQLCIIDPEGDYDPLSEAVVIGKPERAPAVQEVLELLESPSLNAVVNLLGVRLDERPAFLEALLPQLFEMRARTGRPNWIVIDEAHHLLPEERAPRSVEIPAGPQNLFFITVHPERMRTDVLRSVTVALATDETTIGSFASAAGLPVPAHDKPADGEAVLWRVKDAEQPFTYRVTPPQGERRRHARKYAEGDLSDMAFFFRGPGKQLNLRAQNLAIFLQMADGVDDATWLYHLEQGDYRRWFAEAIKDDALVQAADEAMQTSDPAESRRRIRDAIEGRYTAPA